MDSIGLVHSVYFNSFFLKLPLSQTKYSGPWSLRKRVTCIVNDCALFEDALETIIVNSNTVSVNPKWYIQIISYLYPDIGWKRNVKKIGTFLIKSLH